MTSIFSEAKRFFSKSRKRDSGEVFPEKIPKHVAIIMDGNGRWAQRRGLPRLAGHRAGAKAIREVVEAAPSLGIKYLTLYTFSSENWRRPREEVSGLMRLFKEMLENELEQLHRNQVRLRVIGNLDGIEKSTAEEFARAIEKTAGNQGLNLIIALNYSGRADIVRAVSVALDSPEYRDKKPTEVEFSDLLSTAGVPDPELVIRTSGELRLSNFLIWETAYSEFWVTDVLWPDFDRRELMKALYDYQRRERRFGAVSPES